MSKWVLKTTTTWRRDGRAGGPAGAARPGAAAGRRRKTATAVRIRARGFMADDVLGNMSGSPGLGKHHARFRAFLGARPLVGKPRANDPFNGHCSSESGAGLLGRGGALR